MDGGLSQLESDPRVVIYTPRKRFWEREHTCMERLFGPGLLVYTTFVLALVASGLLAGGYLLYESRTTGGISRVERILAAGIALMSFILLWGVAIWRRQQTPPFAERYTQEEKEEDPVAVDTIAYMECYTHFTRFRDYDADYGIDLFEANRDLFAEEEGRRLWFDRRLVQPISMHDVTSGFTLRRLSTMTREGRGEVLIVFLIVTMSIIGLSSGAPLAGRVFSAMTLCVAITFFFLKRHHRIDGWRISAGQITDQKDRVWRAGEAVMRVRLDNFTGKRAQAAVLGPAGYSAWVFNLRRERDRDRLSRLISLWLADS